MKKALSVMSPVQALISVGSTALLNWMPRFSVGPYWSSFEQFRQGGPSALEEIKPNDIASLHTKYGLFRIVRDDDFQRLLGLASDVHRLRGDVSLVLQAARVVARHPEDPESLELLRRAAAMLGESHVLPERNGHEGIRLTPQEALQPEPEEFVTAASVPRKKL